MTKQWELGLIGLAAATLIVIVLLVGAVQVVRYRVNQTSQLQSVNQTSSVPGGLVVALNAPPEAKAKGVLVNYLSPAGVAVRTRPIPNVLVKQARFQVVQDDVFVYMEQGDEPSFRRMDESGSLSAGVEMQRGVSGEDFWLVAPDGQRVAWSETTVDQGMTTSVLFSAGIDGSDKQQIVRVVEAGEFYVRPDTWVEIEPEVWEVRYVKHPFVGAEQAAEDTLSPDQKFVAKAKSGWVEILDVTADVSVTVSPEVTTDIIHIVGWLDHDTLALAVLDVEHPLQSQIFVVKADGSFFRKVWEGFPIGVVPTLE